MSDATTTSLALQIGTAVGAGLASFLATWAGLIRPMKKQLSEAQQAVAETPPVVSTAITRLESAGEDHEKRLEEMGRRFERLEVRLSETVTADSFAAYTGQTTREVSTLTEKVGRLAGIIETWLQHRSTKR